MSEHPGHMSDHDADWWKEIQAEAVYVARLLNTTVIAAAKLVLHSRNILALEELREAVDECGFVDLVEGDDDGGDEEKEPWK